jgi:integrase
MLLAPSPILREPLRLPVEVIEVDGLPKIMAGGCPVTPLNVALKRRRETHGATDASLGVYVRGARLLSEFAAHRGRALIDLTNEDFQWFTNALKGKPFLDKDGRQVFLTGSRCARTADLMIAVNYSLAQDMQEVYGVRFDWYRFGGAPLELVELIRAIGGKRGAGHFRRAHRVPYTPKKIRGLPDAEFERMLRAAFGIWGDTIVDGDVAFSDDAEAQRGALFYRNLGILLTLRFAGARRSEPTFIQPEDVDRENSRLYLVTKGHGGEQGKKLPVLLHPVVDKVIWVYITKYRPVTVKNSEKGYPVFVSHSTRNYGERVTDQTVRKIIDRLRDSLTPPWDKLVSPHTLRHSYASDLQKHGGETAVVVNMRHASFSSLTPYSASPEIFADELSVSGETKLTSLLSDLGIKTGEADSDE